MKNLTKPSKAEKRMIRKAIAVVMKAQPTASSVHVDTPLGSDKKKKSSVAPTSSAPASAAGDTATPPAPLPPTPRDGQNFPSPAPAIDNLEASVIKAALDQSSASAEKEAGENDDRGLYDMQRIIEGMDYELAHGEFAGDEVAAKDAALENLAQDPDFYNKKIYAEDSSDDSLDMARAALGITKDTSQTDYDADDGEGLNLDLGSGQARQAGYLGLDLYPYDHGTIVHDLTLGLPFGDGVAKNIHMSNALHHMEGLSKDPKPLLAEIQRVLMPGGRFHYEGPNQIYNYPDYLDEEKVEKIEGTPGWVKQDFSRRIVPDAATANDAEPRIGIAQYDMLPADALLAMDATGYYWSDATSSGRGNRLGGYPSQGALVARGKNSLKKGGPGSGPAPGGSGPRGHGKTVADAIGSYNHSVLRIRESAGGSSGAQSPPPFQKNRIGKSVIPIFKQNKLKQIVYGVVLAPNEADLQDDFMTAEDIEKAAHDYMADYRVVGSSHEKPMAADVVESYIAPVDFDSNGQWGPQKVKKGSWVLGVKVLDPAEWQKVLDGEYNGFSVGGLGLRDAV